MSQIQPVVLNKKEAKIVEKVKDGLAKINQFGIPIEMFNFKMQKEAQDKAQMILSGKDLGDNANRDLLASFTGQNITIPPEMTFRYWWMINLFGDVAVNAFQIECEDLKTKLIFKKMLKAGILYSDVAYISPEKYGVVVDKKWNDMGEIKQVSIQPIPMKVDLITATGKAISFTDTKNMKTSKGEDGVDFAIFRWNELGMGLFILMMQDICLEIYKKMVIDNNASNLISLPVVKVGSVANFITENAFNMNPFNGAKVQIVDAQSKSDINNWSFEHNDRGNMWIDQLHADLRFHQEYYYNLFGFQIGSAKEQVLSADTKMAGARSEALQRDMLERINLFAESFSKLSGKTVTVTLIKKDLEPQNENADTEEPVSENESTKSHTLEKLGGPN